MNGNDYIISARQVSKTYTTGRVSVHALRGIDLYVRKGEMVAIMGPSGCGKTTMLNCLSGLDSTNSGEIFVENMQLHKLPDDERSDYRAQRMGFIFQLYNLLPVLTAVENVEMPLLISGVNSQEARQRSLQMLGMVGLADWTQHLPAELSGGQRQRVTIARALINNPAIIWADEPTGDLDSETTQDIMNLLISLNRENSQTFVLVTHSLEVGEMCDRIVRMRDGQVIDDGLGNARSSRLGA